jgi:hypothetical protein
MTGWSVSRSGAYEVSRVILSAWPTQIAPINCDQHICFPVGQKALHQSRSSAQMLTHDWSFLHFLTHRPNAWSHFFEICTIAEEARAAGSSCAGENALTGDSASVMHAKPKMQASRMRFIGNTPIFAIYANNLPWPRE